MVFKTSQAVWRYEFVELFGQNLYPPKVQVQLTWFVENIIKSKFGENLNENFISPKYSKSKFVENFISPKFDQVKSGMGMYLSVWGCIWRYRDENRGFGDNPGIKQAVWLFFLSLSYIKNLSKIGLQNISGGMAV